MKHNIFYAHSMFSTSATQNASLSMKLYRVSNTVSFEFRIRNYSNLCMEISPVQVQRNRHDNKF